MLSPLAITMIVLGTVLGVSVLVFLLSWLYMSGENFTRTCAPGETYTVGDRKYTFPALPIINRPKNKQRVRILSSKYMLSMRDLYKKVDALMQEADLEYWVSGGSLISWYRDNAMNPCDDDLDAHTPEKNRVFMWGKDFARLAKAHGLDVKTLGVANLQNATREGAAIRLHLKGKASPAYDMFFESPVQGKKDKDGMQIWSKIDSWKNGKFSFNAKETWREDDIFPIQRKIIDDLPIMLPAKPDVLLKTQYGDKVMEGNVVLDVRVQHNWAHKFLSFAFKKH